MKRSTQYRAFFVVVVITFLSLPFGALAADTSSPPANMPFRYGLGYELFQDKCAECHGPDLRGTEKGPPLLHRFYKPSHHSDAAFYRAIQVGSPQHHWNFGDMPPVRDVNDKQAGAIIGFVRWLQQASGLY